LACDDYFKTDLSELAKKSDSFPSLFVSQENLEKMMCEKNRFGE